MVSDRGTGCADLFPDLLTMIRRGGRPSGDNGRSRRRMRGPIFLSYYPLLKQFPDIRDRTVHHHDQDCQDEKSESDQRQSLQRSQWSGAGGEKFRFKIFAFEIRRFIADGFPGTLGTSRRSHRLRLGSGPARLRITWADVLPVGHALPPMQGFFSNRPGNVHVLDVFF